MNEVSKIPYSYVEKTFLVLPVTVSEMVNAKFILDTGIGLNLISESICKKLGCKITGKHTGKRMSGQNVTISISSVKSLALSGLRVSNVPVGVFDMEHLMPNSGIDGFLSLGFFKDHPFTVDYKSQQIIIENVESMREIRREGVVTPIILDKQADALGVFLSLILPNGHKVSVEVDTGSQALILDERFMKELGVAPGSTAVKSREGKDETGNKYMRYFTHISGSVHLPESPSISSASPEVMFQKIIYDGLVGHHFLSQFVVTYDLPKAEMIFRKQ